MPLTSVVLRSLAFLRQLRMRVIRLLAFVDHPVNQSIASRSYQHFQKPGSKLTLGQESSGQFRRKDYAQQTAQYVMCPQGTVVEKQVLQFPCRDSTGNDTLKTVFRYKRCLFSSFHDSAPGGTASDAEATTNASLSIDPGVIITILAVAKVDGINRALFNTTATCDAFTTGVSGDKIGGYPRIVAQLSVGQQTFTTARATIADPVDAFLYIVPQLHQTESNALLKNPVGFLLADLPGYPVLGQTFRRRVEAEAYFLWIGAGLAQMLHLVATVADANGDTCGRVNYAGGSLIVEHNHPVLLLDGVFMYKGS